MAFGKSLDNFSLGILSLFVASDRSGLAVCVFVLSIKAVTTEIVYILSDKKTMSSPNKIVFRESVWVLYIKRLRMLVQHQSFIGVLKQLKP
jgi:hypothetical protein